jgi:hypothetical protein
MWSEDEVLLSDTEISRNSARTVAYVTKTRTANKQMELEEI